MSRQARNRTAVFAGIAAAALLVGFVLFEQKPSEETVGRATASLDDEKENPFDGPSLATLRPAVSVLRRQATGPLSSSNGKIPDAVPVMGPGNSDSTKTGPRRPHPITPKHESIFRENAILGSLNGAMDVGDVDAMREMNRKYKIEFPQAGTLQEGYDIIADCIEQRSTQRRDRAESYYEEKRASTLRRYVRRYCFKQ
jgi:hypothetical protein